MRSTTGCRLLLAGLALPTFAGACGASGDSDGSPSGRVTVTTRDGGSGQGGSPGGGSSTTTEAEPAFEDFEIDLDQTVHVVGFDVTFSAVEVTAGEFDAVNVEIPVEATNTTDETATPLSAARDISLEVDSTSITDVGRDLQSVPGGKKGKGTLTVTITDKELDPEAIKDAVLTIGSAKENQAVVPFGSEGEAVDLADVDVDAAGSLEAGGTKIDLGTTMVTYSRGDRLMPADTAALNVDITLTATTVGGLGVNWTGKNFSLTLPDGTSVNGEGVNEAIYPKGKEEAMLTFDIATPIKGSYELTVDQGDAGTDSMTFEID